MVGVLQVIFSEVLFMHQQKTAQTESKVCEDELKSVWQLSPN